MQRTFPLIPWCLQAAFVVLLSAFGGGGGSSGAVEDASGDTVTAQDNQPASQPEEGTVMSYADVEPVLQAKCVGCHNSGANPLAPFSLDGQDNAVAFSSAINYVVENQTMPPEGAPGLTATETAQLLSWSSGEPYSFERELLHIGLVEAGAWDIQPQNQDALLDHRPEEVDCPRDTGWLVENGELEIRTRFCNYASLSQQALLDLDSGTQLELVLSHSDLNFNAPSEAHVAISIGGTRLWETHIEIPGESDVRKELITLPFDVRRGDPIEVHLHNHGDNAWAIHSLDAPARGSSLLLVDPRKPSESYLYHKLSAKTFPGSYAIDGSPMPSAGEAISAGQLEAIRLWIEAGAPQEGSAGDTLGRGENELERLLGVCLPEADPINTPPLPPPDPEEGVQLKMPPHEVMAETEREICFAVYEDMRDRIPEEYLTEDRNHFYVRSGEIREDAFTHHNVFYLSSAGVDQIHDPAFGEWTCVGGEREGEVCEPTDRQSCGAGQCRSEIGENVACRGYGPQGSGNGVSTGIDEAIDRDGFYSEFPSHGIFLWNSHSFNLTTKDAVHHVWRNLYFAEDRRFLAERFIETRHIAAGAGTPPFEKNTVCRDKIFKQGDGLLTLNSHTHKRGERKIDYCATYNNGVNPDGSPNIETVTRLSRRPDNTYPCRPVACVAGVVGAPCDGEDDDAACDSAPGAGDGWCDACARRLGETGIRSAELRTGAA